MDKKIIRAALLGFGTVGTGVYKVLKYVIWKKLLQRLKIRPF